MIDMTSKQGKWRKLEKLGLKVVILQVCFLDQQYQNYLKKDGTPSFLEDITLDLLNHKIWGGVSNLCFNIFQVFLMQGKIKN